MDTKMSKSCEFEDNESALPCEPYGKQCYTLKYGRCATKNLCCNACKVLILKIFHEILELKFYIKLRVRLIRCVILKMMN